MKGSKQKYVYEKERKNVMLVSANSKHKNFKHDSSFKILYV